MSAEEGLNAIISGDVRGIASAVQTGRVRAVDIAQHAIDRIGMLNGTINAVTRLLNERAIAEAQAVDNAIAEGRSVGPLAGVPYGVKDLFDVAGLPTTAGAGMRRNAPAATEDAEAIKRLTAAGAVLVATLNMDEYAYGFVTDNAHWGMTHNPHDHARFAGGSSGGSAAAVAAGMLAFTLGSDTNGSIRIPASLCGLFGLKPTHESLPMEGSFPFVDSLDDIGPFARSAADLEAVSAVVGGWTVEGAVPSSKVGILGGWFARKLAPELTLAIRRLADAVGAKTDVELPKVAQARSAAFLMTAWEGGQLHRADLARDAMAYDPATRDRLIAGAALPRAAYDDALAFRHWFRAEVARVQERFDILIAPSTYGPAPLIANPVIEVDGQPVAARANLGLYTQPISFIGLPVVAAPLAGPGMPLGIQIIGRPGEERRLFAFARELEEKGLLAAAPAPA